MREVAAMTNICTGLDEPEIERLRDKAIVESTDRALFDSLSENRERDMTTTHPADPERVAFEAWYAALKMADTTIEPEWDGWKGRAALAAVPVSTLPHSSQRFAPSTDGLWIGDEDFEHDAKLAVTGDFGADTDRHAYAAEICALLNATPPAAVPADRNMEGVQEFITAILTGQPIWPNSWGQDVAAAAFFLTDGGKQPRAAMSAHQTGESK